MAPSRRARLILTLQWVQVACFAWTLWLPVSQNLILYPAFAGIAGTSLLLVFLQKIRIPGMVKIAALVYFGWVLAWAAWSLFKGNPGATHQSTLWLGIPLIWGPWSLTLIGDQARRTLATIVAVCLVGSLSVLSLAVASEGGPSLPDFVQDIQQMWFTKAETGELEMAYLGLSSLLPIAAFVIAAAMLGKTDSWLPPRWLVASGAALAVLAGMVSGRRGLALIVLLVLAAGTCVALAGVPYARPRARAAVDVLARVAGATLLLVLLAWSPFGANVQSLGRDAVAIASSVGGDDGNSTSTTKPKPKPPPKLSEADELRVRHVPELIQAWRNSPVLGNGYGWVVQSGYDRGLARPWLLETQPLVILVDIGLLGVAVIGVVALLLWRVVVAAFRRRTHRAAFTASALTLIAILIGDATNPYLQAPGHGWAVFLFLGICLGIVNSAPARVRDEDDVEEPDRTGEAQNVTPAVASPRSSG